MTIRELRATHRASPFEPFTIHLTDGRTFHVRHPEFLLQSPGGRTVFVFQEDESFDILDVSLITGLEVKKSKKNGKKAS